MKLGIFKNVTRSIAFGLLSTTMLCGGVWGDVFELKEDTADEPRPIQCQTANEFIRFVRENLNDLPNIAINPFERINAKWQMLGYAVFFPTGSTALQQVYVAQKREGKAPNNNARNGGNITDVNNFSHTERQLVWSVLDEYANPAVLTAGMQGRPYASYGNLTGTLHIYTTESPCDAKLKGEVMSCQQFYNDLLCFLPNIKVEIAAPDNAASPYAASPAEGNAEPEKDKSESPALLFDIQSLLNRQVRVADIHRMTCDSLPPLRC